MNWIKSKKVMLPTEESLEKWRRDVRLWLDEKSNLVAHNHPQHLYFTSKEEIKEIP